MDGRSLQGVKGAHQIVAFSNRVKILVIIGGVVIGLLLFGFVGYLIVKCLKRKNINIEMNTAGDSELESSEKKPDVETSKEDAHGMSEVELAPPKAPKVDIEEGIESTDRNVGDNST